MSKKPTILDLLSDKKRKVEEIQQKPKKTLYDHPWYPNLGVTKQEEDLDTELKHTDTGIPYYINLPGDWHKCESLKEFYQLKEGEVVFDKNTIEPVPDKQFAIYTPLTYRYYVRSAFPGGTNYKKLKQYLKDGNLYIK
jgi:hypothetical protein